MRLSRFELRVDEVLVRRLDTRVYHEFGSKKMYREFTHLEAPFSELKSRLHAAEGPDRHTGVESMLNAGDRKLRVMHEVKLNRTSATTS